MGVKGLDQMGQLSEARLWKTLDDISTRLIGIECQLGEIVRLEERVKSHDQALSRYGNRLDSHDARLRDSELWQANYGDRGTFERSMGKFTGDLEHLKSKLAAIESKSSLGQGHKDVALAIIKYAVSVFIALLLFKMTGK